MDLRLNTEKMNKEELLDYINLIENLEDHKRFNARDYLTPNEPQKKFWRMGSPDFLGDEFNTSGPKDQRAFFACNRGGKSFAAAWELSYHAVGDYPDWWSGHTYDKPTRWVAASNTEEQTWLVCMAPLIGTDNRKNEDALGTGMIPKDKFVWEACVGNRSGFREIAIKHVSGGVSTIRFAEYGKGEQALQGTSWDGVWLDESCPPMIHHELSQRLITTQGHMLLTFTPKWEYTEVMSKFYENHPESEDYRFNFGYIRATVWEIDHLSDTDIQRMKNSTSRALWPSVLEGIPKMGGGRIFDMTKDRVMFDDNHFGGQIPEHFPRLIGLDTAFTNDKYVAVWAVWDEIRDIVYIYDWYVHDFERHGKISIMDHVPKILAKAGGNWIPIMTDTKIREKTGVDGGATITKYSEAGLNMLSDGFKNPRILSKKTNSVFNDRTAGIAEMYERMATDRLKIHKDFEQFWSEFYSFSTDQKTGKPQIVRDDAMDAVRYAVLSIIQGLGDTKPTMRAHADYFSEPIVYNVI